MKASELRIGNLVYVSNVGEATITGLDKINNDTLPIVANDVKEFKVTMNLICGITLTDDYLLKLGFQYFKENRSYQLNTESGFTLWGRDGVIGVYTEYNDQVGNDLRHVHELQNIYFALTRKELTILTPA